MLSEPELVIAESKLVIITSFIFLTFTTYLPSRERSLASGNGPIYSSISLVSPSLQTTAWYSGMALVSLGFV